MAIFRIGTTFLALCYSTYLVLAIPLDGCINHAFDSENVTGRSMLVAASAVYTNDTGAFTLSTATAGSRGSTTAATFSPSPPVPTSSPAEFMLEQSATGALGQVADDSTSTVFVLSSTAAVAGVMAVPSMSATPHDTCEGSDNACSGDVTHWDGGLLLQSAWRWFKLTFLQVAVLVAGPSIQRLTSKLPSRWLSWVPPRTPVPNATLGSPFRLAAILIVDATSPSRIRPQAPPSELLLGTNVEDAKGTRLI